MTQPPFRIDQIQIEPTGSENIKIYRTTGGNLTFKDALVSDLTLSNCAGLRNIDNVFIVGSSGAGAEYTSIQGALNAIPDSSSSSNPHTILVFPGIYNENINIEKDGVHILGLGSVEISAQNDEDTIIINDLGISTPRSFILENVKISNSFDNRSCVYSVGQNGTILGNIEFKFVNCTLEPSGLNSRGFNFLTTNNIKIKSCSGGEIVSTSSVFEQVSNLNIEGFSSFSLQMLFDSSSDIGAIPVTTPYLLKDLNILNGTVVDSDSPNLKINGSSLSDLTILGTSTTKLYDSFVEDLSVNGTSTVTLKNTDVSGTYLYSGTPIILKDLLVGEVSFSTSSSESIVFPFSSPDLDYFVSLDYNLYDPAIKTNITVSGFDLEFQAPVTTTVKYRIVRNII